MDSISLLVILMCMTILGSNGKQVNVLKYKGGDECSSALVGVPIISSAASSLFDEFTFCGKYYFRFLRNSFLMSMEPDLTMKIKDFENKTGYLMIQGLFYRFNFPNQTITTDSWHYICLAISSIKIKIVLNGEILFSNPTVVVSKKKIKATKIWLGGALFSDLETNKRFEGMIANADFFNIALQDDDLISITTRNKTVINSAKYDLLSTTIPKDASCMDYLILDENDLLLQNRSQESYPENLLIEYKTDFESSIYLCEGYGGNLTLPKNEEDLRTLGDLIRQSEVCHMPFLGLKKSNNEEILDLKDNPVSYLKWHLNQPNGGKIQKCIITYESYLDDRECNRKYCFFCQILEKSMFVLRGPIPTDTERKYFVTMNKIHTEIRGVTKTECFWNEGKWNYGKNLKLDDATHNMPPAGLKNWNNGIKLKFTQCKKDEFTCYTYGHCIPINKRCDGHPDCPIDGGDENECKIITLSKGYEEKYPSIKNITLFLSMQVYNIYDIDELHMSYTVNFRIQLKWFDSRIIFRNLKPTDYENELDKSEIQKMWTPKLYIRNSINMFNIEAGQNSQEGAGYVRIHKNGSPKENDLEEIDEDYLYPGNENPIIMVNFITLKLSCKCDLKWYPFDTQKCPIQVSRLNDFVMEWSDPPIIQKMILTEYEVLQYLEYDNETSSKISADIEITLCRRLSYHIVNIYIPTLCLIMIAGFTLFIDFRHFEVSIMIALTSMLVTYTLYQSISEGLPHTTYMKMIDIWLFGGLIFPFFIITILVIMDHLVIKETNHVIELGNKGTLLRSTMFMRSMQVILITIGSTLCLIYWVIGLYHYHSACPI